MKAQDVIIARIQEDLVTTGATITPENLRALQDRRRQLERVYEGVASGAFGGSATERERLILRVTRLLGECDVVAPPDFLREVNRYIERWRSSSRFEEAVKRAQQNGYTKTIAAAFVARQLPPQDLLSCVAGERLEAHGQRSTDALGHRQGYVAIHPRGRAPIRS